MAELKRTVVPQADTEAVRKAAKGFTTNVRTHRSPEYVAKKQKNDPPAELSEGGKILEEHALPGGRNNPIHSAPAPGIESKDSRTAMLARHSAGHIKAVSTGKTNAAAAHKSAFHAVLGNGPIPRGMEVPCSNPSCTNINVDKRSCPEGGCRTPKVEVKREVPQTNREVRRQGGAVAASEKQPPAKSQGMLNVLHTFEPLRPME